jgi:cytochrome c oxidase subunit 3
MVVCDTGSRDSLLVRHGDGMAAYYSLVGLHAFHVAAGLIGLSTVWLLSLLGYVKPEHAERIDVLALYWHFVDSVWIVVVMVVYVIGR